MKLINQPTDSAILGVSLVALASTLIYYWYKSKNKYVRVAKIGKLMIYPIKSLGGVEVDHLEVTKNVLKYGNYYDRSWVLLDNQNKILNLSNTPKLVLTSVGFHNGNEVWIDGPDMDTLKIKQIEQVDASCKILSFITCGVEIQGIDCGEEASNWFNKYLNKTDVKLVQHHPDLGYQPSRSHNRRSDGHKFKVAYQNKSGLHVVNENSVRDLNSRFKTDNYVSHQNFRANIIVDGPVAYDEDNWVEMVINEAHFSQLMNCDRCAATAVNTKTGKQNQETVSALRKFRPYEGITAEKKLGPPFGAIFGVASCGQGVIHVNDDIIVQYGKVKFN